MALHNQAWPFGLHARPRRHDQDELQLAALEDTALRRDLTPEEQGKAYALRRKLGRVPITRSSVDIDQA